jgi:3',5'-cyclic-AMP phosphodiesterase
MNKVIASLIIGVNLLASFGFQAKAEENKEPKYTFAVLSDIHIQAGSAQNMRKLEAALRDLNELNPSPQSVVINGDLTEGLAADYHQLNQILQEQPHPKDMFFTIGNHEFYRAWVKNDEIWSPDTFPNGEDDASSLNRFLHWIREPKVYYNRMLNGFPFIFLGSEHYRQTNANIREDAYLSTEQLEWLKARLDEAEQTKQPVFVFLHQPLPETVSGTYVCCLNNRAVLQHEQLRGILSQHSNVFLFSGHTHLQLKLPKTLVNKGFTAINSSSVSQPWDDDEHGLKKSMGVQESEGLIVEVYDDHVWIKGRDFYRKRWVSAAQFTIPINKPWYYFFERFIS